MIAPENTEMQLDRELCPPGIWAGFAAWEMFLRESADWHYQRRESAPSPVLEAMLMDDCDPAEMGW